MENITKFVTDNFKIILIVSVFLINQYIQNVNNSNAIKELRARQDMYDMKLAEQYKNIDALKLDKAVFEATTDKISDQISFISEGMKEMRSDIKELLKNKR